MSTCLANIFSHPGKIIITKAVDTLYRRGYIHVIRIVRTKGEGNDAARLWAMTKLSSTKLVSCVCGKPAHGITCQPFFGKYSIECCFCGYGVRHNTKGGVRKLWNAAMLGLSMEGEEK